MDRPNGLHQTHLILRYIVHLPIIKIGELRRIWEARNAQFRSQSKRKNQFGQIIKIIPQQMDHESNEFKWEIFA